MSGDNFKNINIGSLIKTRVSELNIDESRIRNFLNCTTIELENMYRSEELSTGILLRWSKLLEYDFFRIYSHHLVLYSPPSGQGLNIVKGKKLHGLPEFRKSLYTIEVISFILEMIETGGKTKQQITNEYNIPKSTLYKWMSKYKNDK